MTVAQVSVQNRNVPVSGAIIFPKYAISLNLVLDKLKYIR